MSAADGSHRRRSTCARSTRAALHGAIGVALQESILSPALSRQHSLRSARRERRRGDSSRQNGPGADSSAASQKATNSIVGQRGVNLSGVQRQRSRSPVRCEPAGAADLRRQHQRGRCRDRARIQAALADMPVRQPAWWSRSGSAQCWVQTRSWCWMMAGWQRRARTTSCWPPAQISARSTSRRWTMEDHS